jgi:glycosyltransferase involved in cell wall biosynthesis
MKKISILIPCFNEQENVLAISKAVIDILEKEHSTYDYELLFIDNCSTDNTRILLRSLCSENPRIKAIFNTRNFGLSNSGFYGLCQTHGDCTIILPADFQVPVELITSAISEWEKGNKIVIAIKTKSKENKIMRFLRTCYYKMIQRMSDIKQIEHLGGFALYDESFINLLRNIHDPMPSSRGILAEFGFKRIEISFEQQKRRAGKTKYNWYALYDEAMLNFTSYTKVGLRIATITGFIMSGVTFIIAIIYFIYKLLSWESFAGGIAPLIIGVFFIGSLQLFFIGLIGEYVMSINTRLMNRPLVIEEERINFDMENH